MNLFLYLFYQAVKALIKVVFAIFYAKTVVVNRKNLGYQNPGIVVSNHPNALLDPLQVATRTAKVQFFLANITMFANPISNWFFSTFYCIPIERPKDVEGRGIQNTDSFAKCDAFLSGGGSLYIAPQGAMELKRRLDKIKTGTARIALRAERKNDFNLGMTILPVGLNYSAAGDFRSTVLINVGEPIAVKDYEQAFKEDNFKAARQLTSDLAEHMRELIIATTDDEEEELLWGIEAIQETEEPLGLEQTFVRSQKTLKQLRAYKNQPENYKQLQSTVAHYFSELNQIESTDQGLVNNQTPTSFLTKIVNALAWLMGLPIFLYGWINNYIACMLPALLAKKLNLFAGYTATVKTLSSLFVFPIVYGLQIYLVHRFGGNAKITWAYFLSLYPAGWLAWRYKENWQKQKETSRFKKYAQQYPEKETALNRQRQLILEQLSVMADG